ncbi:hypothetical protein ABTP95_19925, partial [Acinetobacter baumannii]
EWKGKSGYKVQDKDLKKSTIFTFDDDAKTFLEYELGTNVANELMRSQIPIWYWSTRYCEPLKQEEYQCWIAPKGELIAYDHAVENDTEMPSI